MSDKPVESREEVSLSGTITETGKARDSKRVIQIVDGIVKEDTFTKISFASCGHPIHSAQDIGGKCTEKNCTGIPCIQCIRVCERCGKTICRRHAKFLVMHAIRTTIITQETG